MRIIVAYIYNFMKNREDHPRKDYYDLEFLSDLASQSTVRRDISSLHLVWKFDVTPSN